ncbi:MAG: tRNA dihydrouridine synthase DusB [Acidobacteria bacterium]|nr:MAG: tRNA dihydrouridine synthase DusB [Acidobacteriota bacterium]
MTTPFAGKLWLAPLTFGGNLPFRRLCVEFGAEVTVGEMAVVYKLLRDRNSEFALLRSHPDEPLFGAQLAERKPDALAEGARIAAARGARFVDLNCGCPIDAIARHGLGASLLKKPGRLARLVEAMAKAVPVPVTVKLRTGWREGKENVAEVARACEEAGAAAITIHGRTREQRYSKAADWDLIGRVAAERGVPVVGNGDILTHYEARQRMARSGVTSVMLARGALIKPWLFREIREGRSWLPTPEERFAVIWRFVELLREHFRDDERGRRRALGFLPWHLNFFCRYRPLPEAEFEERSREHPLLQSRLPLSEVFSPLERLLADARPDTHARLAGELIESGSREEALDRTQRLAAALSFEGTDEELKVAPSQVAG